MLRPLVIKPHPQTTCRRWLFLVVSNFFIDSKGNAASTFLFLSSNLVSKAQLEDTRHAYPFCFFDCSTFLLSLDHVTCPAKPPILIYKMASPAVMEVDVWLAYKILLTCLMVAILHKLKGKAANAVSAFIVFFSILFFNFFIRWLV